jgi:hypothetical protein
MQLATVALREHCQTSVGKLTFAWKLAIADQIARVKRRHYSVNNKTRRCYDRPKSNWQVLDDLYTER